MVDEASKLSHEPSEELKKEIVHRFWHQPKEAIKIRDYATYFEHYWKICQSLHLGVRSKADTLAARTHEDILDTIDCIWSMQNTGFNETRVSLRRMIQEKYFPEACDQKINNSIDLALRLWLTLNFRDATPFSSDIGIVWNDVSHLSTFVSAQFDGPACDEPRAKLVLGSNMTAVKLKRLNGISIKWASNLKDHLYYDIDRRTLKVFSLEHVLQAHLKSEARIIPEQVINETLLTLHLLFPRWDYHTTKYLKKIGRCSFPDVYVKVPQQWCLTDFYYWQDRLAILYSESQAPPAALRSTLPTLRLLWNDSRNPHQWWTFWFAASILLLTVVFGLITSIATCLQTRYTYQSLQLARAAARSPEAHFTSEEM